MKNVTCDKCDVIIKNAYAPVIVVHKTFDLCKECIAEILKPFEGKGEDTQINRNVKFPSASEFLDGRKYC